MRPLLLATAVLLLFEQGEARAQRHECPKYQVWGASKCEWIAYCQDGNPWQGTPCGEQPPQANPRPAESQPEGGSSARPEGARAEPEVRPQTLPKRTTPSVVPSASPCPDGFVVKGGRCECPPGYTNLGGRCKPVSRDCEITSVFGATRGRKVLLVNGRALELFERYVADLQQSHIQPRYESLRVYYFGPDNRRQELRATMSTGDLFLGTTYADKWKRLLRNKVAADRPLASEDAKLLGADLVCGQR